MLSTVSKFCIFLAGLCFALAACSSPWVTPADTSAANLDAVVSVVDMPASSGGTNLVMWQFTYQGKPVRFASGETVTCNGVPLVLNELVSAYAGRVTRVPEGGTYQFTYTRNGVTTSLSLTVPPRVVFTYPTSGATVSRSNNLTVTYVPGNGTGVDAGASDTSSAVRRNVFESDNGTYTGLDVTSLGPGTGTIFLTRRFDTTIPSNGFHSARQLYDSMSEISITWN